MSNQNPSTGGSSAEGAKVTGSRVVGTGKQGKVTARDLSGWAKTRYLAGKALKWGTALGLVCALVAAVSIYVTYRMIDIPNPNADFQAQTTTVYYSDGKHVLGQFALQNRESIPIEQMPQSVKDAVISAEDRSFYDNSGLDFKGIVRAAWTNLRSDQVEQGASTITQQYVKVLYLSQERTWKRKLKEAFLAVKLQNQLSKDQILEGYLNTIYYGRGAYGIQAAAHAYFEKDAKQLSVPESVVLAAVLNSPGNLDPDNGKASRRALLGRYRYVLEGMVDAGNIGAHRAARAERRLPPFPEIKQVNQYGGQKGYLMTLVRSSLEAEGFTNSEIEGGGLKVYTTLDWDMEHAANKTIKQVRPKHRLELHVALSSVEPGTGALRAMIGGRNFLQSQTNWALRGGQPGSAFKPFALAAGLQDGYTLQSTFDGNSPYTYPNGETVHNEGEGSGIVDGFSYGSAITLEYATKESVNTAYADLTSSMQDGPHKIIDAAVSAGIPRAAQDLEPNLGVALGSAVIANVDMASAYATFAARGQQADWYVIEKVSDANGVRFEHENKAAQAFSPAIASNVTYALQQVVEDGTGANAQELGRPAAGKTGTATAVWNKDGKEHVSSSWFVGYTPQLATAVMYVRGDGNDPLDDAGRKPGHDYLEPFFGANYPTETWTGYMDKALDGLPVVDFPPPAELHGENPTYTPPATTYTSPATTYTPTFTPPPTSSAPPVTSEPPTSSEPSSEPPSSTPPSSSAPPSTTPLPPPPTTTPPPPPPTTTPPPPPPTTTPPPPPPTTTPPPPPPTTTPPPPPPTTPPPTTAPPSTTAAPPADDPTPGAERDAVDEAR